MDIHAIVAAWGPHTDMIELSAAVRDLIARSIDSVESIELLALLHRSANTFWAAEAAAQRLGISPDLAGKKLNALADTALLCRAVTSGAFRYAPSDEALKPAVDELVDAYANRRISVVNEIYAANLDRLKAFTDAFKLKKT
jgi:hypothetical protein